MRTIPRIASVTRTLSLAVGLLSMFGCAALPVSVGAPSTSCLPHFAYAGGWLGGDAVYSIPVPGKTSRRESIWIFGDTYIGSPHIGSPPVGPADAIDRRGARLIHNSVGISRCDPRKGFELEYAWRTDERGAPDAIFTSDRERHYVWPFDGFFLDDRLYVLLLEVREDTPRGPFGLPIRITRSLIARVENPDDPPAYWRVQTRPLTEDGAPMLTPGVFVEGDFVYVMATPNVDTGRHPRFLVRLPLEAVASWSDDLEGHIETFTNRGAWERGLYAGNARVLMADNATEMTLDRIGDNGRYFAVYGAPLQSASDGTPSSEPELDAHSIFVRTAISLTGPWSERRRVHVIAEGLESAEPVRGAAAASKYGLICYAGKAHAEHSPPGVLAMTYVCNLAPGPGGDVWGALEAMQTRMDVYRPKVAVYPWPETEAFAPSEGTP